MLTLSRPKIIDNVALTTKILAQLQTLRSRECQVTFNWIPSHVGIPGNETCDEAAKAATRFNTIQIDVAPSLSQVKQLLASGLLKTPKLNLIAALRSNSESAKWYLAATRCKPPNVDRTTPREARVALHRLRLGYKTLEQINLRQAKVCEYCNVQPDRPLEHYLLDCPAQAGLRQALSRPTIHPRPPPAADLVYNLQLYALPQLLQHLTNHPPPR